MVKKILFFLILLLSVHLLHAQEQEFKRKIELTTFVPKGQWILGSSVSYSEHNEKNYQFLIVDNINADGYTFKVTPMMLYAFRDNIAAGVKMNYKRSLVKLEGVSFNVDEDNQFDMDNLYQLSHSYGGMMVLRNYISIGSSRRFGLYCDIQVEYAGGQSKILSGEGESLTGTYATNKDFNIGVAPGMVAFINNYMAVEVSIGVLGFNFSKVRQVTDQVYIGERSLNTANFRINLFSIGLGISFYL